MATRLYFTNGLPTYTPTTNKGAWQTTDTSGTRVSRRLDTAKAGANTTVTVTETSVTNNYQVQLGKWISAPLTNNVNFTTSDTVRWIAGVLENNAAANAFFAVHVYVTAGDTDTVRGTLLANNIGLTEFPTTATGRGEGTKTLTAVSALAGDRIVVEMGFRNANTVNTSYGATMYYGGMGVNDLTSTSTLVTTQPGWVEFSNDFSMQVRHPRYPPKPRTLKRDMDSSLNRGLIMDFLFNEQGIKATGPIATRDWGPTRNSNGQTFAGVSISRSSPFGSVLDFDGGTTSGLEIGDLPQYNSTRYASFETFLRLDAAPGSAKAYIANFLTDENGAAGAGSIGYRIGNDGTDNTARRYVFFYNQSGTLTTTPSDYDIPIGEWVHLVITCDGTNVRFYQNGRLLDTKAATFTSPTQLSGNWFIGRWGSGTNESRCMDGKMAYLRRWSRVLTDAEIRTLYRNPWALYKNNFITLGVATTITPPENTTNFFHFF